MRQANRDYLRSPQVLLQKGRTFFYLMAHKNDRFNMSISERLSQLYMDRFGGTPLVVRAPGRINFLGEHVDYNHGYCLPAALDKAIYFALGPAEGRESTLYSADFDELYDTAAQTKPAWGQYIDSLLTESRNNGWKTTSFQGVLASDLPIGAGLSSSAALCCGLLFGLDRLFEGQRSRQEIALVAQATEHRIGIKCGLLDQFSVLYGKKNHLIEMDCLAMTHRHHVIDLKGAHMVLVNSNVAHNLVDSAYNDRRRNTEDALATLQKAIPDIDTFRDVTSEHLDDIGKRLTEKQKVYVSYVIEEIQRVREVIALLEKRGSARQLGAYLFATHQGLQDQYGVTCSETDLLVSLGRQTPGIFGARQLGGGFGGCVLYLCDDTGLDQLANIMSTYERETGIAPARIEVDVADGVDVISA